MTPKSIQDILPLVEMPSRYLGTEINRVQKNPQAVDLQVALAYPDLYEIGSSHFGIQILYHLLNQHANIAAERVFAPALDMEDKLRTHGVELFSLESRRAIRKFDILGFSLLYELTYTNVLNMLELSKIPFLSKDRDLSFPLVIAGGPCTCNPEPMADVFDAMVIGDGEEVLPEMCEAWLTWRKDEQRSKADLLKQWAAIEGVYIPVFYHIDADKKKDAPPIKRAIIADLNHAYFPEKPLIPFGKPIHDRLRLEVSRGCSRGCRFCQAGMIYRPVRERSPENLVAMADTTLKATGYEDLSLLSLSTGDYSCINDLMNRLMQTCEKEHVAISLPSLRAGTLNPNLMQLIKKVRKTGFTIAPEAGSQRLRDVINKNITEEDILQTVQNAFEMGWQVIKLYFMVGLPTERPEDVDAIVDLVKKLRRQKGMKPHKHKINVSVATFIPKAHTPFQWAAQISRERSWEIIHYLKDRLQISGVQVKWQNPDVSLIEGIMARGDRRLFRLILAAHRKGCKFDGWNDHFSFEKWQEAFDDAQIDPNDFINKYPEPDTPLPWDHIDVGITKSFFLKEWEKATGCSTTKDCRFGECEACGICDFEKIGPVIYKNGAYLNDVIDKDDPENSTTNRAGSPVYQKFIVTFVKRGNARFLGHLEMVKIFHRALKRIGVKSEFSKGFHPMPKISFDNPLPIGMESDGEQFVISASMEMITEIFLEKLNQQLPDGLQLTDVKIKKSNQKPSAVRIVAYQVSIKDSFFDQNRLNSFSNQDEWLLQRKSPKGQIKNIDLKAVVRNMHIDTPNVLTISLIEESGKIVRPVEILERVFGLQNEQARSARVLKLLIRDENRTLANP